MIYEFLTYYVDLDDTTIFHICNAIFLTLTLITGFFILTLMRQKSIPALDYTSEQLNNVDVHVLYSSNWDDSDLPVFIVLPGNPGQAGFYAEFLDMIVDATKDLVFTNGSYRGCVISHVGHSPPTSKIWKVNDQVDSKIDFIKNILEPNTPITLIGHSFGCYVALKIMGKGIKIEKSILLFPVENMAQMPKASGLHSMLKFKTAIIAVAFVSGLLPRILKQKMIQFYTSKLSANIQNHIISSISELIDSNALSNIFGLAADELRVIKEPDYKLIRKFQHKLVFYYGMFDLWAPLDCFRNLKRTIHTVNAHIADDDVSHTFMFASCRKVAKQTAKFLTMQDYHYDPANLIPRDLDYDFCNE